MHLSEPWYTAVAAGSKTIEGRVLDDKRKLIDVGDTIVFTCGTHSVRRVVWQITTHPDFADAISSVSLERLLPGVTSVADANAVYNAFYPDAHGVVLIYFCVCEESVLDITMCLK